jgi:hypothetical protein
MVEQLSTKISKIQIGPQGDQVSLEDFQAVQVGVTQNESYDFLLAHGGQQPRDLLVVAFVVHDALGPQTGSELTSEALCSMVEFLLAGLVRPLELNLRVRAIQLVDDLEVVRDKQIMEFPLGDHQDYLVLFRVA